MLLRRGLRPVAVLVTALLLLLTPGAGRAAGLATPQITVASPRCDGADPTILLQWSAVPGAAEYAVLAGGSEVYSTAATTWTAGGLTAGQSYSYQIQARGDAGSSDLSAVAIAVAPTCRTTGTLLGAPTLQAADALCYGLDAAVELRWTAVAGATGYRLWRNGDLIGTTAQTSFRHIAGLVPGNGYRFQVQAAGHAGGGPLSNALTATAPTGCGAAVDNPVTLTLDGKPLYADVAPRIVASRTLVPLRAIAEALGVQVGWDEPTRTVSLKAGITSVRVRIDDATAQINGHPVYLDVPATIAESRTLVPVRFVSEAFGAVVIWLSDSRTVVIQSREWLYQAEALTNPQAKAPLTAARAESCVPAIEAQLAANAEAMAALGSAEAQRLFAALICYESGGDPLAIGLNKNRATGLCDAVLCSADLGLGQINVDVNVLVPEDRAGDDARLKANLRADPRLAAYFDPFTNLARSAGVYRGKLNTLAAWFPGSAPAPCTAIPLYNGNGHAIRVAAALAGSPAWYGAGNLAGVRSYLVRFSEAAADDPAWEQWQQAYARVWGDPTGAQQTLTGQAATALRYARKVGYCP